MKFFTVFFIMIALFYSTNVHAVTVHCVNVKIKSFFVNGNRDDGRDSQNSMLLKFELNNGNPYNCGGKEYAYIKNTSSDYKAMLAMAMYAYANDLLLTVAVNDSNTISIAHELAYIAFEK